MEYIKIFDTLKKVFSNWIYLTTSIIIALIFYSVNVLISNWGSLVGFYSTFGFFGTIKFFFILFLGFKETVLLNSYISLIIISILLGILFSLIGYKINLGNGFGGKTTGFFGSIGIFLAAFAPGCVACGIGLASILGIGVGALSFLPYKGLELSIASIGLLGFAIIKITNDMYICKTSSFLLRKKTKEISNKA